MISLYTIILWTRVIHVGIIPDEADLDSEKGSRQTSNGNLAALSNFQDSEVKFDIVWIGSRMKINHAAASLFFTATGLGVLLSFLSPFPPFLHFFFPLFNFVFAQLDFLKVYLNLVHVQILAYM